MKPVKCEFGHHYDSEKYSECPHCAKIAKEKSEENSKSTVDIIHNTIKPAAMEELVHTVVIAQEKPKEKEQSADEVTQQIYSILDSNETNENGVPVLEKSFQSESISNENKEKSFEEETPVMPNVLQRKIHVAPSDDGKTRVLSQSESNPATGVLIALKGPHFGEVFPIYNGKNSISRSINAKIQLSKDKMVSRNTQMYIIFDNLNNQFLVSSGDADTLSYVNKQPILQPMVIEDKAEIRVGESVLIFIPFLSDKFTWEEYIKGDQK